MRIAMGYADAGGWGVLGWINVIRDTKMVVLAILDGSVDFCSC